MQLRLHLPFVIQDLLQLNRKTGRERAGLFNCPTASATTLPLLLQFSVAPCLCICPLVCVYDRIDAAVEAHNKVLCWSFRCNNNSRTAAADEGNNHSLPLPEIEFTGQSIGSDSYHNYKLTK